MDWKAKAGALCAAALFQAGAAAAQSEEQFAALRAVAEATVAEEEYCPGLTFDQQLGVRIFQTTNVDTSKEHFQLLIRRQLVAQRTRWESEPDRSTACAKAGLLSALLGQRKKTQNEPPLGAR